MKNNIYYYNFALKDYGSATVGKLLDMVKVVAFAVQEGRVAIHCHAGKSIFRTMHLTQLHPLQLS
ncbi:protein tyrosine phosphatase domain-containing protein 1-like [Monomorium pharaonis]|uniref:protein tyrosine phosphatase domain-containing protein 1-like n=1 Tax=Monomorium pharaonis TaxID=307658 RepID=UPI001747BA14|nr:protein tyrosine phosphatase domain-containing protein 1-like [Monomorium pharaonis]